MEDLFNMLTAFMASMKALFERVDELERVDRERAREYESYVDSSIEHSIEAMKEDIEMARQHDIDRRFDELHDDSLERRIETLEDVDASDRLFNIENLDGEIADALHREYASHSALEELDQDIKASIEQVSIRAEKLEERLFELEVSSEPLTLEEETSIEALRIENVRLKERISTLHGRIFELEPDHEERIFAATYRLGGRVYTGHGIADSYSNMSTEVRDALELAYKGDKDRLTAWGEPIELVDKLEAQHAHRLAALEADVKALYLANERRPPQDDLREGLIHALNHALELLSK